MANEIDNMFELKKGDEILIYGAGALGQKYYHQLKDIYKVKAFVDKKKIDLGSTFPPVLSLEMAGRLYSDVVIIVFVHNAMWHIEIVEALAAVGIKKVIFIAQGNGLDRIKSRKMNEVYCAIEEENYDLLERLKIPFYKDIKSNESWLIRESEKYVVTFCPRELICVSKSPMEHESKKLGQIERELYENAKTLADSPMSANWAYNTIFRFIMHGNKDKYFDSGLQIRLNLDASKKMLASLYMTEKRKQLKWMQMEYNKMSLFSEYAPIDVEWNERGFFNLIDGQHRSVFSYCKGLEMLPIRTSRLDYVAWKNEDVARNIMKILYDKKILFRIDNPLFSNWNYEMVEYSKRITDLFLEYIFEYKKYIDCIVEIGCWQGVFSRIMARFTQNIKLYSVINDDNDYVIQKALLDLYKMGERVALVDNKQSLLHIGKHICLIVVNDDIRENFEFAPWKLFWIHKLNSKIIHENNYNYIKIGDGVVGDEKYEFGVYEREN